MRLLNLPIPIFSATLVQGIDPPQLSAPAWVNSFLVAIFVLAYVLNLAGKFPGGSAERREASFKDADRKKLDAMHEIVTREDSDKPGWRMVWHPARETREMRDLLIELSDLREDWAIERSECKEDRARLVAEHEQERQRWNERMSRLEEANTRYEVALRHGAGGAA